LKGNSTYLLDTFTETNVNEIYEQVDFFII